MSRAADNGGAATLRRPYTVEPLPGPLGVEVHGIDLKRDVPPEVVEAIREDVTRHRLVVFRDQGQVSAERQVELSHWFGPCESTFYQHPASRHHDVFRVSNDPEEGCTGVGRTGWHIDGSFQREPFSHALYHMVSVPKKGSTLFAPLKEIVDSLPPEQRRRWERLSMASDRRGGSVKPLIYTHPLTSLDTLCFHIGMIEAFVWDYGTDRQRVAGRQETAQLLKELDRKFTDECKHLVYAHCWREGDFVMSDNLAVAHEASPDTQLPRSEVGLRVLHRTTVKGRHAPHKGYRIDEQGNRL